MIKVYIASPYSKGNQAVNVKRQIDMADKLMTMGYAPFVPVLTHFQELVHPRPYDDWLNVDMEWLMQSDVVLRLEGESKGADLEVKRAKELRIPVVYENELEKIKEVYFKSKTQSV